MSDALKQLIEKVKSDEGLLNRFKACETAVDQAKLASELGYEVAVEEFEKMQQDLADEQLDQVAGGSCSINIIHF